jgi:peptidoglycan hydrolase-like protein with peptidoglycan-binding domain
MSGEPTLRLGDHEKDGWVKYLQEQLAFRLNDPNVINDGNFSQETLTAVKKFQSERQLLVDGVVGDQTWAALTSDAPHAPGTDHLTPHTHLDHGTHVVWTEHGGTDDGQYIADKDEIVWFASNVGDAPIKSGTYLPTVTLTVNGERHIDFIELNSFTGEDAQPGDLMTVTMTQVKSSYGSGTHTYEAQMPEELGNAIRHGEFTVP